MKIAAVTEDGVTIGPLINDGAVEAVARSIKEFGFRIPIVAKSDGSERIATLRKEMAETMERGCGIYRLGDSMQATCDKIAELLTPPDINAEVRIVYQSIEGLHAACPGHTGDWYFTGDYPTPGGNRVVNTAFINFYEGNGARAY